MACSGVYTITVTATSAVYVGSSRNVGTRLTTHKTALKAGTHCNKALQDAFEDCGLKGLRFEAVVKLKPLPKTANATLRTLEGAWVARLRREGMPVLNAAKLQELDIPVATYERLLESLAR